MLNRQVNTRPMHRVSSIYLITLALFFCKAEGSESQISGAHAAKIIFAIVATTA